MPGSARLEEKLCVVTGAAQGIGKSAVQAFLREGAHVVATDLQAKKLEAIPPHINLTTLPLDVTDPVSIRDVVDKFPNTTVLLNCAGYVATGTLLECPADEFERSLRINTVAMAETIRSFLPAMIAQKSGSIINIASVVSSVKAAPSRFAYATSKAAVIGLTKSVACDYLSCGIRCNAISPGTDDTPSLHDRMAASGDVEMARASFIARQPMGRLGRPEEIAETAVFLASDEAAFMTGTNLIIDGGMSL